MGESLIQPYYVKDEGVTVVNFFRLHKCNLQKALAKSVPAAAVIQIGRVLFGMIGRKGYVGCFSWYAVTSFFEKNHGICTKKLEFDRGKWNFEWRDRIHRYSKEHRKRR